MKKTIKDIILGILLAAAVVFLNIYMLYLVMKNPVGMWWLEYLVWLVFGLSSIGVPMFLFKKNKNIVAASFLVVFFTTPIWGMILYFVVISIFAILGS